MGGSLLKHFFLCNSAVFLNIFSVPVLFMGIFFSVCVGSFLGIFFSVPVEWFLTHISLFVGRFLGIVFSVPVLFMVYPSCFLSIYISLCVGHFSWVSFSLYTSAASWTYIFLCMLFLMGI